MVWGVALDRVASDRVALDRVVSDQVVSDRVAWEAALGLGARAWAVRVAAASIYLRVVGSTPVSAQPLASAEAGIAAPSSREASCIWATGFFLE